MRRYRFEICIDVPPRSSWWDDFEQECRRRAGENRGFYVRRSKSPCSQLVTVTTLGLKGVSRTTLDALTVDLREFVRYHRAPPIGFTYSLHGANRDDRIHVTSGGWIFITATRVHEESAEDALIAFQEKLAKNTPIEGEEEDEDV